MIFDVTNMSIKQARRAEMADDIDHLPRVPVSSLRTVSTDPLIARFIAGLEQAAAKFAVRTDQFAQGKAATCLDIAAKLGRFGSFASDNQQAFAYKLIGWSAGYGQPHPWDAPVAAPVAPVAAPVAVVPAVRLTKLHDLMQRLSKLVIGNLTIARKNQDSLCWVKVTGADGVIGKIDNGVLTLYAAKLNHAGLSTMSVTADLQAIELDPEAAAVRHGIASGRCSVCSRDLTDPVSMARGIGPICLTKFAA